MLKKLFRVWKPKKKIKVLGVIHAVREEPFKRNENLKRLYQELKELRSEGITRIGLEYDIDFHQADQDWKNRNAWGDRYWKGIKLLLKRLGIDSIEIEDPKLFSLVVSLEAIRRFRRTMPVKNAEMHEFNRFFPKGLKDQELDALIEAVHFARSIKMVGNAKKQSLQAVIVGINHSYDYKPADYVIVRVDKDPTPQKQLERKKHYAKYGRLIQRILKSKAGNI